MRTKHTLRALAGLFRARLSKAAMYRLSFYTGFIVDTAVFLTQLVFFRLIAGEQVAGWSSEMYGLFIGSFIVVDALDMTTWFFGVVHLPEQIRSGSLDLAILKPVNTLVFTTFGEIDIGSSPCLITGLIIVFVNAAHAGTLTLWNTAVWLTSVIMMSALMYALALALRCVSFWTVSTRAMEGVEGSLVDGAMRLPLPAITQRARWALLLALPYGLVANFPAMCMAGRVGFFEWGYAFVITAVFLCAAIALWKKGLRHYESASS